MTRVTETAGGIARREKFRGAGAIPGVVVLMAVFVAPLLFMLWRSFSEPTLGLQHYAAVFTDRTSLVIILRTLEVSVIVAVVTVLLAYPYAYLMTIATPSWRTVLTLIVLIPFWISLMARTFAWYVLFQSNGPLDHLFESLHLGGLNILGSAVAVTIGMAQVIMPFAVFPLYSTMQGIDRTLLQAAQGLGARRHVAFARIYLPLSRPGIISSWFLVFVLSLGFYVTPQILGSSHNALLSQYIAIKIGDQLDFGFGSALAVVLVIVTGVILGALGGAAKVGSGATIERV